MSVARHRRRVPRRAPAKSLALHDRLQRPSGLAGVIAQGGSDSGVAGQAQDGDGKVAQAGHDAGPVAGADLGAVFVVGDVADPVDWASHCSLTAWGWLEQPVIGGG